MSNDQAYLDSITNHSETDFINGAIVRRGAALCGPACCDPSDVLHPDDWPDHVDRPRQIVVGSTFRYGDDDVAVVLTHLSVTDRGSTATISLDPDDLRRVVTRLQHDLRWVEREEEDGLVFTGRHEDSGHDAGGEGRCLLP